MKALRVKHLLNILIIVCFISGCSEVDTAELAGLPQPGVTMIPPPGITMIPPPGVTLFAPTLTTTSTNTPAPTRTLIPTLHPTNTLSVINRAQTVRQPAQVEPTNTSLPTLTKTNGVRTGTIRELGDFPTEVLARASSTANESPATLGLVIGAGGTVRTLDRGKARIDLNEGTIIRLSPKTSFTITELNQDSSNPFTRLQLEAGKIWITLTGGRMDVETPIGAASIRGSMMSVEFNRDLRQLTVTCLETQFNCSLVYQGLTYNLSGFQKIAVPPLPPVIKQMDAVDLKEWLINVPGSSNFIPPTLTPQPVAQPAIVPTSIVVNTLTDELNNDGDCSLREAIQAANTNTQVDQCIPAGGSDTITFSVTGVIPMSIAGTDENANLTGDYDITESLTIIGNGAANTIISGSNLDRIFHITTGTVSLSGMTISNGNPGPTASGGAILVAGGTAALSNVTILSNTALRGGGVYLNAASLTISGSTIKSNTVTGDGGGIYATGGTTLTIYSGTIGGSVASDKNTATNGGGIYAAGTTTISTSATIQNNESTVHGGGIYNNGSLTISSSTINNNKADSDNNGTGNGGGVWNGSTAALKNSTLSGNSAQDGGGVTNNSTLSLELVTLSSNSAKNNGGGIINVSNMTIVNTTISGNISDSDNNLIGEGGGIAHGGTSANLSFVTIINNKAGGAGVGGFKHVTAATIKNSIITDQTGALPNCGGIGVLTAIGSNFSSDATCAGFTNSGAGSLLSTIISGGPPAYHLLVAGSVAKDAITPANCTTIAGGSASPAQNGQVRPTNINCDAGSIEMP